MVKNLPANIGGDTDLLPEPGKSHMLRGSYASEPQLLSQGSGGREPQLLKPECPGWSLCPAAREATSVRSLQPRLESSSHSAQLEKSLSSDKDGAGPKINKHN